MRREAVLKSEVGQFVRVPHVRLGAVVALALAAAFAAWLIVNHSSTSPSTPQAGIQKVAGTGPEAMSIQDLKAFAAAIGHPVYWAGPRPGTTYELTQTGNGRVYIRYLPQGVRVGVNKPFLTVATYPYPHAFAAIKALAKKGAAPIKLDQGGMALVDRTYPKSIHLAYPSSDYQVEIFDPSPPRARDVVVSGQIAPVG
jgi:hypothetical protein